MARSNQPVSPSKYIATYGKFELIDGEVSTSRLGSPTTGDAQ
ncbi:hypothetical protein [Rhodococcus sp. ARC_M6]|nr:hypothetical protein [Rhodococcus sp. ARC_M6]